jgi:hypothetical protein
MNALRAGLVTFATLPPSVVVIRFLVLRVTVLLRLC